MRKLSGIMASDAPMLDGVRLTLSALYGAWMDLWDTGVPQLVSHDAHRLSGWMWPLGVHLEPGLAKLLVTGVMPESETEREELSRRYGQRQLEHLREHAAAIAKLREGISPFLSGDEGVCLMEAPVLTGDGLARRVVPEIFAKADKDGLVKIPGRSVLPGVYSASGFLVFAHPAFRKSLSRHNALNYELLDALERAARKPGSPVRIRLDEDAVGLDGTARRRMECEYWYGPRFHDGLAHIATGVTRHEASEEDRFFHGVCRTEFWWQSRDNDTEERREHIFEAEEVRERQTFAANDERYGCRYVHSIVDENGGRVLHLDGAIREYDPDQLLRRLDVTIANAGRGTAYTKLWRIDRPIPVTTWKTLVHHHFRGNPLVGEYLGMEAGDREPSRREPESQEDNVAPAFSIQEGDGIRLVLAFTPPSRPPGTATRWMIPTRTLRSKEAAVEVMESVAYELAKAVMRRGGECVLPKVAMLESGDRYHGGPTILHATREAIPQTVAALCDLLSVWKANGDDRVLSVTLGVVDHDSDVRVSMMGHCVDLLEWLMGRSAFPPAGQERTLAWLEEAYSSIRGRRASNTALAVDPSGSFYMQRAMIDPARAAVDMVKGRLRCKVSPEPAAVDPYERTGRFHPTVAFFIEEATCTRCGGEYASCPCSVYLDGTVRQIRRAQLAYAHWSDRPRP